MEGTNLFAIFQVETHIFIKDGDPSAKNKKNWKLRWDLDKYGTTFHCPLNLLLIIIMAKLHMKNVQKSSIN